MCGRFTLSTPADVLAALFDVESTEEWNVARYNIAPTVDITTIDGARGRRGARSVPWGIANPKDGRPLINARSETVATSALFSRGFLNHRVLIPADGFFEWVNVRGKRRARYFTQKNRAPFAFAGLIVEPFNERQSPPGAVILTTAASPSVSPVHDRMPVLIAERGYASWLDHRVPVEDVQGLVREAGGVAWESIPVGTAVNDVRNDRPDNIAPSTLPEAQGSLFQE